MKITLRIDNIPKYLFGWANIDDYNMVSFWQDSNILEVPDEGIYYCFSKRRKNGRIFSFPVVVSCGDTEICLLTIEKIRRTPNAQSCKLVIETIKRLPVQVSSKTVTAVVAVNNSNTSTTGLNEVQICSSFGTAAQEKETWYYRSDLILGNGVSLFTDNARTLPIPANKTFGLIIDNKQYTFKSDTGSKITALEECVYESNSIPADGLFYTSYFEWIGNIATEKKFTNKTDLWNTMNNPMPIFQAVVNNISTSGSSSIDLGDQVFINNVQITGNYFIGYFNSETPYFIRVSDSIIAEIGVLAAPTSNLIGTTVVFPKLTRTNDPNNTGYGYLSNDCNYFKQKLTVSNDGKTINYVHIKGNGDAYIYYYQDKQFTVTPWYRINKGEKIYGIPVPFVVPESLRGSTLTLICSADVTFAGTITQEIKAIMANIVTEINGLYILKIGQ